MIKTIIQYAVVRFQPYPEIGEFVNIGVIALDPKKGVFRFKLAERHSKRVTDFFHNLDRRFYLNAVSQIKLELEARTKATLYDPGKASDVFSELTKPKSNLFQFEQVGALKAVNIESAVDQLYSDFIGHEFARARGYEEQLKARVKLQLESLELDNPFVPYQIIGPGGIKTRFELVRVHEKPEQVIKPFGFNDSDSGKLSDHTFNELKKLEFARKLGQLEKKDILIPYDVVTTSDSIKEAWAFLKPMLEDYGDLVEATNVASIRDFALQ